MNYFRLFKIHPGAFLSQIYYLNAKVIEKMSTKGFSELRINHFKIEKSI